MDLGKAPYIFAIIVALLSCRSGNKGIHNHSYGLNEIHLPNQAAENDFNKGIFYVRQENYSAAKDFFLQANEECPNTPAILNAIGNCMDQTGNAQQGFPYFEKAMQIDSNFAKSYVCYGASLNDCRRFDDAEKILRLGLGKHPISNWDRSGLYRNLAYTYYRRDQNDQALSLLDSAKMGLPKGQFYDEIVQFENHIKQAGHYPQSAQ